MLCKPSSNSSVQVLHQQIRVGGEGERSVLMLLTQREWGVQDFGKPADVILERSLTDVPAQLVNTPFKLIKVFLISIFYSREQN